MSCYDSNSYFSYNQTDFIDLDAALAEEELASISYSSSRGNESNENTFKLSFKSYDDNTVERLRRSLITPLSASQVEDPMYESLERSMYRNNQTNNLLYNSTRVDNSEPNWRAQTSMSPTNSVADSLAGYNKIINDSNEVDLVKSDLKDFMENYNISYLMSRSGNSCYSSPSPQDLNRYDHHDTMTTGNNNNNNKGTTSLHASNINRNSPDSISLTQSNKHIEGRAPYRGSLLRELASKPVASEVNSNTASHINPVYVNITPKEIIESETLLCDERIHDATPLNDVSQRQNSINTRSSGHYNRNVVSTSNYDSNKNQSHEAAQITGLCSKRCISKGKMKTAHDSNQHKPTVTLVPIQRQHLKETAPDESSIKKRDTPRPIISRYSQRRASTDKVALTNESSKQPTGITSRYTQRRPSNERVESMNEVGKKRDTPVITSRYSQIRLSNEKIDSPNTTRDKPTITSRYSQRRPSNEKVDIENEPMKRVSRDVPTVIVSRYSQRRLSTENSETKKTMSPKIRNVASRYMQSTSINHVTGTEQTESLRTTQPASKRNSLLLDKRASIANEAHLLGTNDKTTPTSSRISAVQSNISRRSSLRASTGNTTFAQGNTLVSGLDKRASYHGGHAETHASNVSQQRRPRSFSIPSNEHIESGQPPKHSLLPVLSTRVRKFSHSSISKQESVPENNVAPRYLPKEVRFSRNNHDEIHLLPSHSTDESNSTVSSQSEEFDTGPSTPPRYSYLEQSRLDKRKSIPIFSNKDTAYDSRPRRNSNSYLNRTYEVQSSPIHNHTPTTTRYSRHAQAQQKTESLTESVRDVLAHVRERRARNAAIIKGLYQ